MNFLANRVVRQLIYFWVGLLGVVLFSSGSAPEVAATTATSVSFAQSSPYGGILLIRNPTSTSKLFRFP
jgi:hypothetical protein